MRLTLIIGFLIFSFLVHAGEKRPLPSQPTNPSHPGSSSYPFGSMQEIDVEFEGRTGTLYLPMGHQSEEPFVTIAFGHGRRVPEFSYRATFLHLARKGAAVLYVPYERTGSDKDFDRMAGDYNRFVTAVVKKYSAVLDQKKIIFSGHSNGARVAFLAAGLPASSSTSRPSLVLGFAIPKNTSPYLQAIDSKTPCVFVVGEDDTEDPPQSSRMVYDQVSCQKQLIVLSSYKKDFKDEVLATHGSFRTFGWYGSQISSLHYYGYWKFLLGAVEDVNAGATGANKWLFGDEALETGDQFLKNKVIRPMPQGR